MCPHWAQRPIVVVRGLVVVLLHCPRRRSSTKACYTSTNNTKPRNQAPLSITNNSSSPRCPPRKPLPRPHPRCHRPRPIWRPPPHPRRPHHLPVAQTVLLQLNQQLIQNFKKMEAEEERIRSHPPPQHSPPTSHRPCCSTTIRTTIFVARKRRAISSGIRRASAR